MIDLNDLIGKPFDPDGYGPDNYSCYGLAVEVFKRYGIEIPRTNISVCACRDASQQEIQAHIVKYWEQTATLTAPTAMEIRSSNPDFANHVAVYIGNGRLIHVTINQAVVVDRVSKWKHKIIGSYKYVGHIN